MGVGFWHFADTFSQIYNNFKSYEVPGPAVFTC